MASAPVDLPLPETATAGGLRFSNLRGVRWRIHLGILPSSPAASIDDLRRVAANSRRSYASLRRCLLVDPYITKNGNRSPDLSMDNPLSQNPESTWGRFFRNAELERTVNQDLSRLYPEDDRYFQTPACQAMLRRILLVWCLRHPEYGYRQGMHELLAPLVYVLHVDLDHLSQVRGLYEDYFNDEFDGTHCEVASNYRLTKAKSWDVGANADDYRKNNGPKITSLDDLDPQTKDVIMLSDSYGAEGELGMVLSERFMEHDAYCMFDGLMIGAHGVVAMAEFFSSSPSMGSNAGVPPVIEASSALYHFLSIVDSSLHSHLVELGVEPQYFALRWLRVLFGREFTLSNLLVIWDELFSSPNDSCVENVDYSFRILCSPRGAFISTMAVSMLLHVRSSLLATEHATSCLQRLLNFPRDISVKKLIEKAMSFQALALEANVSAPLQGGLTKNRSSAGSRADSLSPKTPIRIVSDSYWEERWRVLHEEKVIQNGDSSNGGKSKEFLGETLALSRAELYPSPAESFNRKLGACSSVRRSLINDLSRSVDSASDAIQSISPGQESPPLDEDVRKCFPGEPDLGSIMRTSECMVEETCISTENSVFSTNTGPNSEVNDPEIESEKSSISSNSFSRDNEYDNNHVDDESSNASENSVPKESEAIAEVAKSEPIVAVEMKGISEVKVRKSASGKFQWFWRLRKGGFNERSMEKGTVAETQRSSNIGNGTVCPENIGSSAADHSSCGDSAKVEVGEKKIMGTLKNLGQSMLENIQVIELLFQQERGQAGNISGGRGQDTAMAALKELRKVSNILSEM